MAVLEAERANEKTLSKVVVRINIEVFFPSRLLSFLPSAGPRLSQYYDKPAPGPCLSDTHRAVSVSAAVNRKKSDFP